MERLENVDYYGYVFENERGSYEAYVSRCHVDDEKFSKRKNRKDVDTSYVAFRGVSKIPQLGRRVSCNPSTIHKVEDEVARLKPVGKFGIDDFYYLSGSCTLLQLDENEQKLPPSNLIKTAQEAYDKYQKVRPKFRSRDDLLRLGMHEVCNQLYASSETTRAKTGEEQPQATTTPSVGSESNSSWCRLM